MAVYVDKLENWGWKLRGHRVMSCHMFSDVVDLAELHDVAFAIGMKRAWFQDHKTAPHYDLTADRRQAALKLGVIEVGRREAAGIWKARRELVARSVVADTGTQAASEQIPAG